jgi:GNAT superfamily N-acetyltransferase
MVIREATIDDIPKMSEVRMSVKENVLNNPGLVKHQDYVDYLTVYGKGWVAEVDGDIAGFAIVGLLQNNIWALFVHPYYEKKGIGRKLHDIMMQWYFENTKEPVWLSTAPGTRAEAFYTKAGWKATGMLGNEIKFEKEYNK